jgi:hypothetical protein
LAFIESLMDLLVQKNVIAVDDITSLLAGATNTPRAAPNEAAKRGAEFIANRMQFKP